MVKIVEKLKIRIILIFSEKFGKILLKIAWADDFCKRHCKTSWIGNSKLLNNCTSLWALPWHPFNGLGCAHNLWEKWVYRGLQGDFFSSKHFFWWVSSRLHTLHSTFWGVAFKRGCITRYNEEKCLSVSEELGFLVFLASFSLWLWVTDGINHSKCCFWAPISTFYHSNCS